MYWTTNAQLTFPIRNIYYLLDQELLQHNLIRYLKCIFGFLHTALCIILWRANIFGWKASALYSFQFISKQQYNLYQCTWQLNNQQQQQLIGKFNYTMKGNWFSWKKVNHFVYIMFWAWWWVWVYCSSVYWYKVID